MLLFLVMKLWINSFHLRWRTHASMSQCERWANQIVFSFAFLCSLHLLALISFYMDWNAKNTHTRRHHNYVYIKLTSSTSKSLLLYVHIKHSILYTAFRYLLMIITCVMDIRVYARIFRVCVRVCATLEIFSKE